MTVFIDGSPAARKLDKTDAGSIITGSPDVLLGEAAAAPLTPFQAQWLYNYLSSQRDVIPFEYVNQGCEVRADYMCEIITALGIPVEKQWVRFTPASGKLHVAIDRYPGGGVTWEWHVAPIIDVATAIGPQKTVIDPSLGFREPVTVEEWIRKQSTKPEATVTESTSKDIYRRGWNLEGTNWDESRNKLRDSAKTHRDLEVFRGLRATLPEDSGRRIRNNRVHF